MMILKFCFSLVFFAGAAFLGAFGAAGTTLAGGGVIGTSSIADAENECSMIVCAIASSGFVGGMASSFFADFVRGLTVAVGALVFFAEAVSSCFTFSFM